MSLSCVLFFCQWLQWWNGCLGTLWSLRWVPSHLPPYTPLKSMLSEMQPRAPQPPQSSPQVRWTLVTLTHKQHKTSRCSYKRNIYFICAFWHLFLLGKNTWAPFTFKSWRMYFNHYIKYYLTLFAESTNKYTQSLHTNISHFSYFKLQHFFLWIII